MTGMPHMESFNMALKGFGIDDERRPQVLAGWGLSIALHACLLLTLLAAPKLTLKVEEQPFQWDVALVEPTPAPAVSEPAPPATAPAPPKPTKAKPQPAPQAEPLPRVVTRPVQQQTLPQPIERPVESIQRKIEPVAQEAVPITRELQPVTREVLPQQEAERPIQHEAPPREVVAMEKAPHEVQEVKPVETPVEASRETQAVQEAKPVVEKQVAEVVPAPVEARPAPAPVTSQPVTKSQPAAETRSTPEVVAHVDAVETPSVVEQPMVAAVEKRAPIESQELVSAPEPLPIPPSPPVQEAAPSPDPPAPAAEAPAAPQVQEQPPMVARSVTPNPATRSDNRWLAESLHRRMIELRHYPSNARLNGMEGKVVLRVAIRRDGNLDSVSVLESSGHEVLDNAAMETVRRACPLHLRHELSTPMVVVKVPMYYSLTR